MGCRSRCGFLCSFRALLLASIDYEQQFWQAYPRRVEKKLAMARLRQVRADGVPWATLIDGVAKYCRHITDSLTEDRYVKHPAVWLNKGCWDDEHGAGGGHRRYLGKGGFARFAIDRARAAVEKRDGGYYGKAGAARLALDAAARAAEKRNGGYRGKAAFAKLAIDSAREAAKNGNDCGFFQGPFRAAERHGHVEPAHDGPTIDGEAVEVGDRRLDS
jgi:hypothetical protein